MAHLGRVSFQATLHISRVRTFELRCEGSDGKLTCAVVLLNGRNVGTIGGPMGTLIIDQEEAAVEQAERDKLLFAYNELAEAVNQLDRKL